MRLSRIQSDTMAKEKIGLNQIQVDLLSSFLVGHWKEISKSEHRVAFERILETLNPGSLQAVKNLPKGGDLWLPKNP